MTKDNTMKPVGIEAINTFGGTAYVDVKALSEHRQLDSYRFDNLLMHQKAVALPYEDPITCAVNAAKPILDAMSEAEKERIELLITCSESGIDFGKSMSTYIHHHLEINRNCRLFEIKQACYSGTAGFQMGINFVLSQASPGAKALIVATDISRFIVADPGDALTADWSYAEPSSGAGAVAILVSDTPKVFQVDVGANGYYGYEVMDTCRPAPDGEAGNADTSLLSYLDCHEQAFKEYQRRVADVDYRSTFQYLAFHTPFGGMVKGAHRNIMRKLLRAKAEEIESDFQERVTPGLRYCQRVGNVMGGTILLSLASTIDNGNFELAKRIGLFSYGSGCCSEFYSGMVLPDSQKILQQYEISKYLDLRYKLPMDEYDTILMGSGAVRFGTRNVKLDHEIIPGIIASSANGRKRLYLTEIKEYHREYDWH